MTKYIIDSKYVMMPIFSIVILFLSCEKGPNFREFTFPKQSVTGIYPGDGFPSQIVTITGADFGDVVGPVKVFFNGVKADSVLTCTDNQITVKVPNSALSGKVTLTIWDHTIDSIGSFIVYPMPAITSVISKGAIAINIAQPGDEVWISGKNFITDPSKVSIDFNGTPATQITSLTENLIKVIAPEGYTAGTVNVTFNNLKLSGSGLAPGISPGDVSVLFLKNYTQPFIKKMTAEQTGTVTNGWATPADWIVNAAAQNQINTGATERCGGLNFGKSDATTTGQICLQAGWGDATANVLTNGKMYQTITLPAGTYQFVWTVKEFGGNANTHVYLTATMGTTPPNTADVPTSSQTLGYTEVTAAQDYNATPVQKSFSFTLTEQTTVSLGIVATMAANSYVRFNSVALILK